MKIDVKGDEGLNEGAFVADCIENVNVPVLVNNVVNQALRVDPTISHVIVTILVPGVHVPVEGTISEGKVI